MLARYKLEAPNLEGMLCGISFGMAQISNKVKIFSWQAARDMLPTKENLFAKNILSLYACEICKEDPATMAHTIGSCCFTMEVVQETT